MIGISSIDDSQRKAARVAGFTGLFTMATAIFANYGISERLIVTGDAAATARNILAHETLFRLSIACYLVYGAGVVVLLAALYVVLRPVNRGLALVAAFWRLVYALMWAVFALNSLHALRLLGDATYLHVFEPDRLQAMARLSLGKNFDAYYVGLPFYGLASTLCFYLWFQSRYIPRILAAGGAISSAWCAASAFVFIVFPGFGKAINLYSLDTPLGVFEMATSFWLLFKGLRPPGIAEPDQVSGRAR
jgi:hypothetical protein